MAGRYSWRAADSNSRDTGSTPVLDNNFFFLLYNDKTAIVGISIVVTVSCHKHPVPRVGSTSTLVAFTPPLRRLIYFVLRKSSSSPSTHISYNQLGVSNRALEWSSGKTLPIYHDPHLVMHRTRFHVAGRRMRFRVSGRNAGSTPALGDCFLFLLAEGWTTHELCVRCGILAQKS